MGGEARAMRAPFISMWISGYCTQLSDIQIPTFVALHPSPSPVAVAVALVAIAQDRLASQQDHAVFASGREARADIISSEAAFEHFLSLPSRPRREGGGPPARSCGTYMTDRNRARLFFVLPIHVDCPSRVRMHEDSKDVSVRCRVQRTD